MSKRLFILIGAFFCLFLNSGFSVEPDIRISGDITIQSINRDLSLGSTYSQFGFNTRDSDAFFISQTRLRFDADINDNISAVIRFLNERCWGSEDEVFDYGIVGSGLVADSDLTLDLAYFTIEEMFGLPLALSLGRQNLSFGRGFIIGNPDTDRFTVSNSFIFNRADDLSLRKSFDAARLTLDYSPLVINLVYAKIEENFEDVEDDVTLAGFNAGYHLGSTLIEGYFWSKENNDKGINNNAPSQEYATRIFTAGLRADSELNDHLTLYAEYAYQFGDYIGLVNNQDPGPSQKMRSFAAQLGLQYRLGDSHDSQVDFEYSYASTDNGDTPSRFETWDVMFEDQRIGEIAQVFWSRGLQYWKLSCSTRPKQDLLVGLNLYYLLLSDSWLKGNGSVAAAYPAGSRPGSPLSGNVYILDFNKKGLGAEIDPYIKYDYSENVQLGIICGFFIPGSMWNEANNNTAYSIRTFAKVTF